MSIASSLDDFQRAIELQSARASVMGSRGQKRLDTLAAYSVFVRFLLIRLPQVMEVVEFLHHDAFKISAHFDSETDGYAPAGRFQPSQRWNFAERNPLVGTARTNEQCAVYLRVKWYGSYATVRSLRYAANARIQNALVRIMDEVKLLMSDALRGAVSPDAVQALVYWDAIREQRGYNWARYNQQIGTQVTVAGVPGYTQFIFKIPTTNCIILCASLIIRALADTEGVVIPPPVTVVAPDGVSPAFQQQEAPTEGQPVPFSTAAYPLAEILAHYLTLEEHGILVSLLQGTEHTRLLDKIFPSLQETQHAGT